MSSDVSTSKAGQAAPRRPVPAPGCRRVFAGTKGPLIGLVLLCLVLTLATDTFLTVRNILNVLDQITVLGIMAIGMTLVILIGGIDLSVGSVLALAAHGDGLRRPSRLSRPGRAGSASSPRSSSPALCGLVSGLLVTRGQAAALHRHAGDDVGGARPRQHHHRRLADRRLSRLVHRPVDHPPFRFPVGDRRR